MEALPESETINSIEVDSLTPEQECSIIIAGLKSTIAKLDSSVLTFQGGEWYIDNREYCCRPETFSTTIVKFIKQFCNVADKDIIWADFNFRSFATSHTAFFPTYDYTELYTLLKPLIVKYGGKIILE
jgi:hypothetical protein